MVDTSVLCLGTFSPEFADCRSGKLRFELDIVFIISGQLLRDTVGAVECSVLLLVEILAVKNPELESQSSRVRALRRF